jgi:hypothetical protein
VNTAGGGAFVEGGRERPEINNRGQIVFSAHLASGESGAPSPAVFTLRGDERLLVAREGTPAPGTGAPFAAAEFPAINDSGTVVFHAAQEGADRLGVYRWQTGKLTAVAVPGVDLPGGGELEQAFYPQVDSAGRVLFVGRTRAGDGLYRWDGSSLQAVVRTGDRLPGIGRVEALDFHRRKPFHLNAAGAVAFVASSGKRKGLFLWDSGRLRPVALAGLRLPGVGVAEDLGTLDRTGGSSYGPPAGPPGSPYGYGPPGGPGPSSAGPPGYPAGGSPGYPSSGRPGYPGGGNPGYGGGFYGYRYGGSFGVALSDDGKVLFAAAVRGQEALVMATPKTAAGKG